MAENIKTIQLRLNTINQVSKITNAMNLVSMSKLQKFQRQVKELSEITKEFDRIETEPFKKADELPILAIGIASDLGLASLYNRTLQRAVRELDTQSILWIGKQGYDRFNQDPNYEIHNRPLSSDHVNIENFYDKIIELMPDYRLRLAVPYMSGNTVEVRWEHLNQQLVHSDFIVYEPDYETANQRFQEFYIYMTLYEAYYQSKFTENMSRRIAMEQATENAMEMREELNNRYNQLRQEEITQEILELSAGVE